MTARRLQILGVCLVLILQIAQSFNLYASPAQKSYWLISYRHGFVRRGLAGEIIRGIPVSSTSWLLHAAALTVALAPAALLGVLVVRLLRRGDSRSLAMALLLAASPFTFESLLHYKRPDQLGLVCLLLVGFVITSARFSARSYWTIGLLGAILAIIVLIHEGAALIYGAFIVPLIVCIPSRIPLSKRWAAAAAFFAAPTISLLAVLLWGRISPSVLAEILHDPQLTGVLPDAADVRRSVIPFLADSIGDGFSRVVQLGPVVLTCMACFGLALIAVQVWALRLAGVLTVTAWRSWPKPAAWLWAWLVPAGGAVATFLTGIDWIRWFAEVGCSLLVLWTFALLSRPAPSEVPVSRLAIIAFWVVSIYLVALRPLGPLGFEYDVAAWFSWLIGL